MKGRNLRRNSNRGRGRSPLLVREATYALPIIEPANFMEIDCPLDIFIPSGTTPPSGANSPFTVLSSLTFGDIATGINRVGIPSFAARKFRVTSIVVDPILTVRLVSSPTTAATDVSGGIITSGDVSLARSGVHYTYSDANKPLRIRLSPSQGSSGEWLADVVISQLGSFTGTDGYGNALTSNSVFLFITTEAIIQGTVPIPSNVFLGHTEVHVRIAWQDSSSTS